MLLQRHQPVALDRTVVSDELGIGRADTLDDPDACQNRLSAARPLSEPSTPISK
jgi:hypothetical protein